jgi:hypothetical protein
MYIIIIVKNFTVMIFYFCTKQTPKFIFYFYTKQTPKILQ